MVQICLLKVQIIDNLKTKNIAHLKSLNPEFTVIFLSLIVILLAPVTFLLEAVLVIVY